jgi:cytochrome oxidase assembly protein ShyY1
VRSLRFLLSRRWLLFALIVVVLVYATWWLGEWQFHRLAERKASNAIVRTNLELAPAPVDQVLAPGREVPDASEWRQVEATGTYDTADTVIVRYRTRDGQSGIEVLVPLRTASGTSLLVDRGWMQSDNEGTKPSDVPAPPVGRVDVVGWVRADATGDATSVQDNSTRAISSRTIGTALHQRLYGGFVALKAEDGKAPSDLLPVEMPELDNGPHFFYGLQWWFFGVLAVAGFLYLAYDEWRSRRSGEESVRADAVAARKQARAAKNARRQKVRAAYQQAYAAERRERDAARGRPSPEPAPQPAGQSARSMPPSTGSTAPETNDAAGDSRNAATRPNSAGSP